MYINNTKKGHTTQVLNLFYLQKNFGSSPWPIAQYRFRIWIAQRIRNRIRKKCSQVNRGPNGVEWWIKSEDKSLTLLSLEKEEGNPKWHRTGNHLYCGTGVDNRWPCAYADRWQRTKSLKWKEVVWKDGTLRIFFYQSYGLHQQHVLEHKHTGPRTGQIWFIDAVTERIMTKRINRKSQTYNNKNYKKT